MSEGKMPIRILYDEGGFYESHGGVTRYFTELMKRLGDYGCAWKLAMVSTGNSYLQAPPFNLPPHLQTVNDFIQKFCGGHYFPGVGHLYRFLSRFFPHAFPSGEVANMRAVDGALTEGNFDVYHPTAPHLVRGAYKRWLGTKPMVVTVHDLIPEVISNDSSVRRNRKSVLNRADAIVAVSENTKKDILRLYNVPEEKIHVIYHGYLAPELKEERQEVEGLDLSKPYLVFIGKRDGYKNFTWFLRAVAPLLRKGLHLVCTGTPFPQDEKSLLVQEGVSDQVVQRFFTDGEMTTLLRQAVAFVYPSLYEGFGIPILDAFAARCPVILSKASCFPEVGGDAALYFEVGDEIGLRTQISRLLEDSALRESLIEKGFQRKSLFSWDKCAQQTVQVYQEVVGKYVNERGRGV